MSNQGKTLDRLIEMLGALSNGLSSSAVHLGTKEFEPLPEDSRKMWEDGIKELQAMAFEDVDSVFITVVHRLPEGKMCPDCHVVHDRNALTQMVLNMGSQVTVKAAIIEGMEESERRTQFTPSRPNAPGPRTPQ